ncbi:hypothetical protein FRB96_003399 [Tulasnella sp. 330]|nr:hypothetical protein FRB96_003399 [Tulasnella sp. 330]
MKSWLRRGVKRVKELEKKNTDLWEQSQGARGISQEQFDNPSRQVATQQRQLKDVTAEDLELRESPWKLQEEFEEEMAKNLDYLMRV